MKNKTSFHFDFTYTLTTMPTMGKNATSPWPINLQEAAKQTAAHIKIATRIGVTIWPIAIVSIVHLRLHTASWKLWVISLTKNKEKNSLGTWGKSKRKKNRVRPYVGARASAPINMWTICKISLISRSLKFPSHLYNSHRDWPVMGRWQRWLSPFGLAPLTQRVKTCRRGSSEERKWS